MREICNQTATGMCLDPVTFSGIGRLRGNISWNRLKISIVSYKAISNICSISQSLIFSFLCVYQVDM